VAHRLPAALALSVALLAGCAAVGSARWQAAPPLLQPRAAHAVVATPDAIYALAGTGAGGRPVREVERFDGQRWQVETALPGEGLNAPAAAVLGRRIVLIGGFGTTTNVPTAAVRIYDTATRRWSDAAPLPHPRGGHAAVLLDGRIHVVGGGNAQSTIADHTVYDPATDRWSDRAPLPRAMGSPAAVVHDGMLHTVGGRSGLSDFGEVWRYDAAADRWTPGPPIPPRGTAGAVSHCGAVFVIGGESQARQAALGEVLRLDPGGWVAQPPLPTPRNFARSVVWGGSVWVVGGSRAAGSSHASQGSDVVEKWSPRCGG
jgi:N-acetylneuraminic acid mutarotase